MKRTVWIIALLMCIISFPASAPAKLAVAGPAQMIKDAPLIVVGTVTERNFTKEVRKVTIRFDYVLKGRTGQKEIKLARAEFPRYSWLDFDFPEVGAKMMLLLDQDETGNSDHLFLDANNIGKVIDNNTVKLYKGMTLNGKPPALYEQRYSEFLRANYKPVPVDAKAPASSLSKIWPYTVVLGAVIGVFYFIWRRKKG